MSFDKFSKLPTELRLIIWRRALPGPRVMTMSVSVSIDFKEDTWLFSTQFQADEAALDGLYYTCLESRTVVRDQYEEYMLYQTHRQHFFDCTIDTLYIVEYLSLPPGWSESALTRSLQHVAVAFPFLSFVPWEITYDTNRVCEFIKCLPKLKKLTLVLKPNISLHSRTKIENWLKDPRELFSTSQIAPGSSYDPAIVESIEIAVADSADHITTLA